MIASHSSIEVFANMRSRRMPALFTTASSRPNASSAAFTSAADCSKSATSAPSTIASPPSRRTSAATSLRGARVGALAARGGAEVVHHDARALARELERVLAADPAPGSGHDHDAAFTDAHVRSSWSLACREPAPNSRLCENPPVDWDDLRTFLAVARAGSLADAARGLGVSYSTVSRRLAALEHGLGVRLFDRSGAAYRSRPRARR